MFTNNKATYYARDKVLIESACLSKDSKPTTGIANGSTCLEMDTGKRYAFNEEDGQWEELPSSGGGGGGSSDFSTAEVTINGMMAGLSGALIAPHDYFETYTSFFTAEDGDTAYTLILYKGKAVIRLDAKGDISTSGSIELIEDGMYFVTGNCTITISYS